MGRDTLTGSRIRERRMMLGLKQADLARRAEISASYLNLIEHNRRRIGGKLLLDLAHILGVETNVLTEGAGATLIATLREAAAETSKTSGAELDRVDEFAGRFPGWAGLLADNRRRIDSLERTIATLNDRMTHDPHLAETLHEMLSTVTAIRSTASILAEPGDIEPEWQTRFHRNINEDSARLAETSRSLVQYLDTVDDATTEMTAPQEEVETVLSRRDFRFEDIENGSATPEAVLHAEGESLSKVARQMLLATLYGYADDVAIVDFRTAQQGLRSAGADPFALARAWNCAPSLAMRRIAALAPTVGLPPVALAICDASGTLTYRQATRDMQFPRFGAACSMLPIYQALSRPVMPILQAIEMPGQNNDQFVTYAYSEPAMPPDANQQFLMRAHMLVVPITGKKSNSGAIGAGVNCGICPRVSCPGRREPSILSEGL